MSQLLIIFYMYNCCNVSGDLHTCVLDLGDRLDEKDVGIEGNRANDSINVP